LITGRVDRCHQRRRGHRLAPPEIESALVAHPKSRRGGRRRLSARIKGQGIYAYVTLRIDQEPNEQLRGELVQWVRKEISPIAAPDLMQWAREPAEDPLRQDHAPHPAQDRRRRHGQLGDVSTLADPTVRRRSRQQPHEPRRVTALRCNGCEPAARVINCRGMLR